MLSSILAGAIDDGIAPEKKSESSISKGVRISDCLKESCGFITSNETPRCCIMVGAEARGGRFSCRPNVTCCLLVLNLVATGGCGKLKLDNESVEVLDV